MTFYLIKRLLVTLATLLAASVVVFAVLEVLPGNAAQVLMGPDADPAAVAAKAAELGLDAPEGWAYKDIEVTSAPAATWGCLMPMARPWPSWWPSGCK